MAKSRIGKVLSMAVSLLVLAAMFGWLNPAHDSGLVDPVYGAMAGWFDSVTDPCSWGFGRCVQVGVP